MAINDDVRSLKFSIIIPAYNSEKYIDAAINSVLHQSYKNLELIIINDGSTDNTLSIIKKYAQSDGRVIYLSKKNGKYVSAIKKGIEIATGDYVIFLGSDDYLDGELLLNINNLSTNNPDLFIFNTFQFNFQMSRFDIYSNIQSFAYINNDHFFEDIKDIDNGKGLLCNRDTSKAYKLKYLKELCYYGKYGVDADDAFAMLYARKHHTYCFIPITGYYNFLRSDSVSAVKPSTKVKVDIIKVWSHYFKQITHNSNLNMFEKEFLYDSLDLVNNEKKQIVFLLRNYHLIKKYKRSCFFWLLKYNRMRFVDKLSLASPILYFLAHSFYKLFKK